MRTFSTRPAPRTLAVLVALFLPLAPAVAAAAWLPLAVGNQWHYMDEADDDPHSETITGTGTVRGYHVFVKEYAGGFDDGLLNFWQTGADGSVLLCGYYKPWYPFGLVYEPPVRVLPGQPSLHLEWNTHTVAYEIPDNVYYGSFDTYWEILGEYDFVTPAGSFHCLGAGEVAPPAVSAVVQGHALALDGREIRPASGAQDSGPPAGLTWYSDGTGIVRFETLGIAGNIVYTLQSASGPTPATPTSWGRIKRLYR
jgi:hypothetical protein